MPQKHHKYAFVVICKKCGIRPLTLEEYMLQLDRPDDRWYCPQCLEIASWDDNSLVTNTPPLEATVEPRYKLGQKLETGEFGMVHVSDIYISPSTGDVCFEFSNDEGRYWAIEVQDQQGNVL